MNAQATTSAVTSTAPAGGGNGAGSPAAPANPLHALANLLSEETSPAVTEPQDAPPPPAEGDPATAPASDPDAATGQDNLPSETTPETEGEPPEVDGEPETVSSPTDNAELTQALSGLSPKERQAALELVKTLQPGEIPRIGKLLSERHQDRATIEAQQKQIEELESARVDALPTGVANVPPNVAKLKTVQEVEARQQVIEGYVDEVNDFLDANPGDPATTYRIGEKDVTRQELINRRAEWRAELKALPKHGTAIAQRQRFTQAQAAARAQIVQDFPVLSDPEHADTKTAQQLLKSTPQLASYENADYLALALARGHRELQAELAARKGKVNGNGHGKPPFGTPPTRATTPGGIPKGKPSAPAGGAPPRPAPDALKLKTALDRNGSERNLGSLAGVLAASGR